jgi:hypothetical protein
MPESAVGSAFVRVAVTGVIALTLATCTSSNQSQLSAHNGSASPQETSDGSPPASPSHVTMADAKRCPVTLPSPHGPSGSARQAFFGWGSSYGNGKLWVGGLWPHGLIIVGHGFVDRRGRVGMKFGWWRTVDGRLRITGRRLDGPAPALQASVPAGYGATGFQSSGVIFPTEGCWQITGAVHRTTLTFVTFVIKRRARIT